MFEYVFLGSVGLPRRWTLASAGEEVRGGGDDDAGRVDIRGPEDGKCAFLSCTSSGSVFGVILDDMIGVAERVVSDDVLEPSSDAGAVEGIGVVTFLDLVERRDALCWEESGTTDADDGLADWSWLYGSWSGPLTVPCCVPNCIEPAPLLGSSGIEIMALSGVALEF